MKILTLDQACIGAIICERPYVKLLAVPRCTIHEPLPGIAIEQWTALAQVEESLAIVELHITPT